MGQELQHKNQAEEAEKGIAKAKEAGHEFIDYTPEEKAKWIEAVKPFHDKWAANIDSQGLPGTDVVSFLRQQAAH